jgi:hypothetical protein
MSKYGYFPGETFNPSSPMQMSGEMFAKSLRKLQEFGHLPVTGKMDKQTLNYMNQSRCGVTDDVVIGNTARKGRRKRYASEGSQWSSPSTLTYKIVKYPIQTRSYMTPVVVNTVLQKAFETWSKHITVNFSRVTDLHEKTNIEIRCKT